MVTSFRAVEICFVFLLEAFYCSSSIPLSNLHSGQIIETLTQYTSTFRGWTWTFTHGCCLHQHFQNK